MTRHDLASLRAIYDQPFFNLIQQAREVYRTNWPEHEVQLCTLMSIKTGGCTEDCAYCAQSAHHATGVEREALAPLPRIVETAERARANGSTRFCMGAAWRGVTESDPKFAQVLETVRAVAKLGMEVCVTLGQLTPEAARQLRAAGVTAYNHNLDTSPEFYPNIVTTHTFEDRLATIRSVQAAGMSVCCGGIIGMGESELDRLKMLEVLCGFDPTPESVPINCLMPVEGTPSRTNRSSTSSSSCGSSPRRESCCPRPACGSPPDAPGSRAKARRSASLPARTPSSTATSSSPPPIPPSTPTAPSSRPSISASPSRSR